MKIRLALLPKDEADARSAILEIRPAAGGDEASLFAAELFQMYQKYAESKGWRVEVLEYADTGLGGLKEGVAEITGRNVFARLKIRIRRPPRAARAGHREPGAHPYLDRHRCRAAGGGGGRRAGERDRPAHRRLSGVRRGRAACEQDRERRPHHHIPSGVVVAMQEERSQHKNRAKAMKILRARLYEAQRSSLASTRAADRKSQVGTGTAASAYAPTTSRRAGCRITGSS